MTTRRSVLAAAVALAPVPSGSAAAAAGRTRPQAPSGTAVTRARAAAARMSPAQQIGQLFTVAAPATAPEKAAALVGRHQLGGVLLDGRSLLGVTDTAARVADLRRSAGARVAPGAVPGVGIWVATNQEGGFVQTLDGPGFSTIPTAQEQWALTGPELVAASARWARQLARSGVDLNLAPVTDVVPGDPLDNPPIGALQREYGRTPNDVEWAVAKVVRGYRSAGVTATLKHFPGLGKVSANTDTHADVVDPLTTRSALTEQPWRTGIAAGAGLVMISSARYARIDPRHLAVFSSTIVTGMLRGDLGWTGVVISDDLGSAAAVAAVAPGLRAVSFIAAGGDVVLSSDPDVVPEMVAAVLARGHASPGFRAQIGAAVVRVLTRKAAMGLLPG